VSIISHGNYSPSSYKRSKVCHSEGVVPEESPTFTRGRLFNTYVYEVSEWLPLVRSTQRLSLSGLIHFLRGFGQLSDVFQVSAYLRVLVRVQEAEMLRNKMRRYPEQLAHCF